MYNGDQTAPKRRLGAILFADIADYARLMGQDEIGTWQAVKQRIETFNAQAIDHGARRFTRRLPPPGLPGGIKGSISAHSSSVRSLR
jgi:class 3 adenylate cyclase